ncbi:MAG: restriction endonuclease [Bacteroidales bacterium]|nr:restriction endonuclease [Bacteroidales bacterium]
MAKKGAALERLVALIQDTLKDRQDVVIQTNVKLVDNSGINREIDVLVSTKTQKLPIQIAFECKDYSSKAVDIQIVDAFIGKCKYLPQIHRKILVSTSGYSTNAIARAKQEGIELCLLEDIPLDTIFQNTEIYRPQPVFRVEDKLSLNINLCDSLASSPVFDSYNCYNKSDDSLFDFQLDICQKLFSIETQMELVNHYMSHDQKPFVANATHKFSKSIYIKSTDGRKFDVTDAQFIVNVDFIMQKGEVVKQQKIVQGEEVYITENFFNNSPFSAVVIESGERYKAFFKIEDKYIEPSLHYTNEKKRDI